MTGGKYSQGREVTRSAVCCGGGICLKALLLLERKFEIPRRVVNLFSSPFTVSATLALGPKPRVVYLLQILHV